MSKTAKIIFISLIGAICLAPFICMLFVKNDVNSEKRTLAPVPKLVSEEGLNVNYLPELGAYFEDHYAFRSQLVAANSKLQADVFGTSPVDTIVKGTDGWLYYTDSLADYQQTDVMSDREAFALAYNMKLVQESLAERGIEFLYTVAPNKNSLYAENMPYYYKPVTGNGKNIDAVKTNLVELGVNYADLFEAFKEDGRILYRLQDSHWNGEGAVLAYNVILDRLGKTHDAHENAVRKNVKTATGDLATSLYGVWAENEWDTVVDVARNYINTNQAESWEANTVLTEALGADGSLLMFRDSFGNTLSPLLADVFGKGAFSKASIYQLDSYVEMYKPDTVIFEIVERNMANASRFSPQNEGISGPPIMAAPKLLREEEKVLEDPAKVNRVEMTASVSKSQLAPAYGTISGDLAQVADEGDLSPKTEVVICVDGVYYKTYMVRLPDEKSDYGFLAYFPWDILEKEPDIKVYILKGTE